MPCSEIFLDKTRPLFRVKDVISLSEVEFPPAGAQRTATYEQLLVGGLTHVRGLITEAKLGQNLDRLVIILRSGNRIMSRFDEVIQPVALVAVAHPPQELLGHGSLLRPDILAHVARIHSPQLHRRR